MIKFPVGANRPKDLVFRNYIPGQDDERLLQMQRDANERWKDQANVLFTPALPKHPELAIVGEFRGKPVMFAGCRIVLEMGLRVEPEHFESQAQLRDVLLEGAAHVYAHAKKNGFNRIVCSVTSPTPKWVNFLKKRLGLVGYGAEFLSINLE